MASLTGQTISSTYDGLLKTTDNDVLTSGGKVITDGLGNSTGVTLDTNGNVIAAGTVKATGGIKDSSDDLGTSGQILSSTGTGTNWIDSTAPVDSVNSQTGVVVLDSDDIAEGATNLYNQTHTGDVTGATALTIANDVITYAKLGAEFTTSAAVAASAVDFSTAQVFTKTLTAPTDFTYAGTQVGMVKDLVINANGNTFTLPPGTKIIAGTPTTGINFIQVVVTAAGEFWTSISQAI
jgi:hypothetical protein